MLHGKRGYKANRDGPWAAGCFGKPTTERLAVSEIAKMWADLFGAHYAIGCTARRAPIATAPEGCLSNGE